MRKTRRLKGSGELRAAASSWILSTDASAQQSKKSRSTAGIHANELLRRSSHSIEVHSMEWPTNMLSCTAQHSTAQHGMSQKRDCSRAKHSHSHSSEITGKKGTRKKGTEGKGNGIGREQKGKGQKEKHRKGTEGKEDMRERKQKGCKNIREEEGKGQKGWKGRKHLLG